jgi:hypothetical protein
VQTTINRTSLTKTLDCLVWLLSRINNNNGFLTDTISVDRTGDPRAIVKDLTQEYRQYGTQVHIRLGDTTLQSGNRPGMRGTLGGEKRKLQVIEFVCYQALADVQVEAGITGDMIQDWLRRDIEWGCIYYDQDLKIASTALSASIPLWGVGPSYFNPLITKVLAGPKLAWPNFVQVIRLEYFFSEMHPLGKAGNL